MGKPRPTGQKGSARLRDRPAGSWPPPALTLASAVLPRGWFASWLSGLLVTVPTPGRDPCVQDPCAPWPTCGREPTQQDGLLTSTQAFPWGPQELAGVGTQPRPGQWEDPAQWTEESGHAAGARTLAWSLGLSVASGLRGLQARGVGLWGVSGGHGAQHCSAPLCYLGCQQAPPGKPQAGAPPLSGWLCPSVLKAQPRPPAPRHWPASRPACHSHKRPVVRNAS